MYDHRTSETVTRVLEQVRICIDPRRCDYRAYEWVTEPDEAGCNHLIAWAEGPEERFGGPTTSGLIFDCVVVYDVTYKISVRHCCDGIYGGEIENGKRLFIPDADLLSRTARKHRSVIDTIIDCITTNADDLFDPCTDDHAPKFQVGQTEVTGGCLTTILSFKREWMADPCYPDATEEPVC